MIRIGITISLAGKPRMKDISMKPSRPSRYAKGSNREAKQLSILEPFKFMLARSQMIAPVGAATHTALLRTNKVRSNIERIIILPI